MWVYWVMFIVPAAFAMRESVRQQLLVGAWRTPTFKFPSAWWFIVIGLTLLIGLRYEVGGDWWNYLRSFDIATYKALEEGWWSNDPGYRMFEWIAMQADWGIYGVNFLGAFVFSIGLVVFCRHLPRPWLALAVSIPYLVIILGMGYSRQGIALGLLMIGLVALGNGQVRRFVLWTVLAATFHKSAVVLIPIAALASSRRRFVTAIWVSLVALVSYIVLLQDTVETLTINYIEAEYQSQGALIRLVMNALPAIILLWRSQRFESTLPQQKLWFWMSLIAIGLVLLYFVSPSSTAVDRMGLYLLPLQLMVFSHLPEMLGKRRGNNNFWVIVVLVYYAMVEFVWLNFATHAFAWLPYRFYPFEGLF